MKSYLFLLLTFTGMSLTGNLQAQGTAFTYQGQLNGNGSPANGSYDLVFTLYATNTTGTALAGPVTNTAVAVSNGLFTTLVDFGPSGLTGASNWLEIAVSPSGSNAFVTLAPRQQLTPAPYAITAANLSSPLSLANLPAAVVTNAASGVNLSGTFSGSGSNLTGVALLAGGNTFTGNQIFNGGTVGIRTINPDRPLAITGTGGGGEWISLQNTNSSTVWHMNNIDGGLNFAQTGVADERLFLSTNGDVGFGTPTPGALLQLNSGTQRSERLRLSGQEFYQAGNTATDGVSLLLGVNRLQNRQLWVADSARLSVTSSNPVVRIFPGGRIDAIATDGNTPQPLTLASGSGVGLTIATNGNVGIGTTTPGAPLQVSGNILMGSGGVYNAASGSEALRIVRGDFQNTGAIGEGAGFTVTSNSVGNWTITFTPAFSGFPTVTFQAHGNNVVWTGWGSGFMTFTVSNSSGTLVNPDWISFIAMGPP